MTKLGVVINDEKKSVENVRRAKKNLYLSKNNMKIYFS